MYTQFTMIFWLFCIAEGYKILCLLPIAGKSHEQIFIPVVEELIKKGHQVTCVWPGECPMTQTNENLKIIKMDQIVMKEIKSMQNVFHTTSLNPLLFLIDYINSILPHCENFFQNNDVKRLIKNGKEFDLVLIDAIMNECALSVAHTMGNITAALSPNVIMPWTPTNVPRPPSYVPNMLSTNTLTSSLFSRLLNTFYFIACKAIHNFYLVPLIEKIIYKHMPEAQSVDKSLSQLSLILTNTDPVIVSPRPQMPNFVSVGGLHCKAASSLPEEFQEFIHKSGDDGFILISLGSNAQSKNLPENIRRHFLDAFSRLKQFVIWKYESTMEQLPNNIMITKWMPQQDLLGHPKIRLFITHGGLLSLQQAIYHGVPIIGIPLFADQPGNVARMEELQLGLRLSFANITTENILYQINEILQDKRYSENMEKYSKIFRDEMGHPLDKAVYWIEYLIRHGSNHLRNLHAEDLNSFQYFLIDLIIFTVFSIFFPIFVFVKFIMAISKYYQ